MKKMWPWIIGLCFVLGLVSFSVYLIGARLPENHSVEASQFVPNQSPRESFTRIGDVEHSAGWRRGVSATILSREGSSSKMFKETGPNGTVIYRQTATVPDAEIINEIASDDLPYGGTWTIRITPVEGGSNVSIREDGFVKPPLFRFAARFVFGYSGTLKQYLQELAAAR